jgi:hypothetical protein
MWETTDFVCAVNVAVDDELGAYCVTKGDGTYRCWGAEALEELPPDRYVRVQITGDGGPGGSARYPIVGLTDDDRLSSVGLELPADTPSVGAFRATNMGGLPSVCPLLRDGSFRIISDVPDDVPGTPSVLTYDGHFFRAFCAWEGLAIGIHTDGTMWSNFLEVLPGNDWLDVAHSAGILCGMRESGDIACGPSIHCNRTTRDGSCDPAGVQSFPPGHYRQITATGATACALDERGLLVCQRYDGEVMAIDDGPFTFIEGGKDVVCGIRENGSVACFRHGGSGSFDDVTPFVPVEPLNDPDW